MGNSGNEGELQRIQGMSQAMNLGQYKLKKSKLKGRKDLAVIVHVRGMKKEVYAFKLNDSEAILSFFSELGGIPSCWTQGSNAFGTASYWQSLKQTKSQNQMGVRVFVSREDSPHRVPHFQLRSYSGMLFTPQSADQTVYGASFS